MSEPTISGSAPTRVATSGRPHGHLLDGRQAEALVERRDRGDLGGLHQLDELLLREPGAEGHGVADAQLVEPLVGRAVGLGPADADQVGVGTLDAQLGERVEQHHQALERHIGAGDDDDAARDGSCRRPG